MEGLKGKAHQTSSGGVNCPAQKTELSEVLVLMMIGREGQGRGQRAAAPELNRLPLPIPPVCVDNAPLEEEITLDITMRGR